MTKAKSNAMTDFGLPIIVLVLICAIMSGLLAFTNGITAPIIEEAERKANEAARLEVMPEAGTAGFEEVAVDGELPAAVTGVYKAANGAGYTFSIIAEGYGGKNTLKMAVGISADGKITGTKVLSQSETPGLGAKITTEAFQKQFSKNDAYGGGGVDSDYVSSIDNIQAISGATRSSNFYRLALKAAFEAFDLVKGVA